MPSAKHNQMGVPPPEPEHLPCPRCDSTNTKFCYYNNYNFSQPRHYCKACRRYWTHGGTLRDIPVGGGSRKNAKRSRHAATTATALFAGGGHDYHHLSAASSPFFLPIGGGDHGGAVSFMGDVKPGVGCGSFTSLLNGQGPGLLSLGEFGLGLGNGFEDVGFGLGRGVWAFSGPGDSGSGADLMGNTWQVGVGENGFVPRDCFSLPDLSISTPGNAMK